MGSSLLACILLRLLFIINANPFHQVNALVPIKVLLRVIHCLVDLIDVVIVVARHLRLYVLIITFFFSIKEREIEKDIVLIAGLTFKVGSIVVIVILQEVLLLLIVRQVVKVNVLNVTVLIISIDNIVVLV
jgi:hypothetical protein